MAQLNKYLISALIEILIDLIFMAVGLGTNAWSFGAGLFVTCDGILCIEMPTSAAIDATKALVIIGVIAAAACGICMGLYALLVHTDKLNSTSAQIPQIAILIAVVGGSCTVTGCIVFFATQGSFGFSLILTTIGGVGLFGSYHLINKSKESHKVAEAAAAASHIPPQQPAVQVP